MEFDPVFIARIQFAFTIACHIAFPTLTIGLSAYVATLTVLWVSTGRDRYQRLARFWTRIMAIAFAMGVTSGVFVSLQFAANWSGLSSFAGGIVGPLMGYGVIALLLLEATFLGVMLFGWGRIPPWLHVLAALAVSLGALISAFWMLSAISWMNTPAGHAIVDGVARPIDWWAIVFNPSFPYRIAHVLNAAYLTAGFVVLAVGARYLLADRHPDQSRTMLRMSVITLTILAPLQLLIGDQHGLNTLKHQPMKVAAMEAHWDGAFPGDFHVFAWPDETNETNRLALSIPKAASLILTHRLNGQFPGLKDVPAQDRPPVATVFFAFRIMLAIGFMMIATALAGAWLLWLGILFETRWYLHLVAHGWWTGFAAVIAGWIVTESGRQPYVIQGLLRTADAASPGPASYAGGALSLALLMANGIVLALGAYAIGRMLKQGPQSVPKA